MSEQFPLLDELVEFITERWNIHVRRSKGLAAPWTSDPILQTYRFCNVRREDDRVTKWIHQNWLRPHEGDLPGAVYAMCLARIVNHPETLVALGYPLKLNTAWFVQVMEVRKADGLNTFNGAYMINAVGATKGQSKASYLAAKVLPACWAVRGAAASALQGGALRTAHTALTQAHGMGSFMAAQVIADCKWTPVGLRAADWYTFAASGPGSKRGLNRVCGRLVIAGWKEEDWHSALLELRSVTLPKLPKELRNLDAQNLQNCLCEFDKHQRVKLGQGRPKQYFKKSEEPYV